MLAWHTIQLERLTPMNSQKIEKKDMLPVGSVLKGIYRIERHLSSGGFGNTYVAVHVGFDETYAVKEFFMKGVTHRHSDGTTVNVSNVGNETLFREQLEKFKKEARRLYKLKNGHIVAVHNLFDENGTAYYVMDYIDGESLSERLKRLGHPLAEQEVMGYLPQILDALGCAHREGFLHLDLKPANVMLDKNGLIRLIDFGASKQLSLRGGASANSSISYTKGFAPREQTEENVEKFGPWTDLYALGATLYNLLTGNKPALPSDIDDDHSADKHLALPFPEGVTEPTRNLIRWLMTSNRKKRPQNINEILQFLSGKSFHKEEEKVEDEVTVIGSASLQNKNTQRITIVQDLEEEEEEKTIYSVGETKKTTVPPQNRLSNKKAIIKKIIANMVMVEGGTFTMGATQEQGRDSWNDEMPSHIVTVGSFYIGRYAVTQEEWMAVMGSVPPQQFMETNRPVECVSWDLCQKFIEKLNTMTYKKFRLPTEAEWEFAARGGIHSRGYKYAGSNNVDDVAWWGFPDTVIIPGENGPFPVGQKLPNELGLYDMSGNVWEWCNDWYGEYYSSPQINPKGHTSGCKRVLRGGCSEDRHKDCRVSTRRGLEPNPMGREMRWELGYFWCGLRLAL